MDSGDSLSFGATGLPAGLVINSASGAITGTVPATTGVCAFLSASVANAAFTSSARRLRGSPALVRKYHSSARCRRRTSEAFATSNVPSATAVRSTPRRRNRGDSSGPRANNARRSSSRCNSAAT
ncbi:MAG: putative Ig domain-containing protein [Acidobacteriota bacterium]